MAGEPCPLGKLIESEANRDAVHVAIAPGIAAEKLSPGQDVGFVGDKISASAEPKIGIVDPFLKSLVFPEQRCFVCLYPNSVTGMRHHWAHPAFDGQPENTQTGISDKSDSETWMRQFADDAGLSFERVLEIGRNFVEHGDYHVDYGHETSRNAFYDLQNPSEFWKHFRTLTGIDVSDGQSEISPFSCSC